MTALSKVKNKGEGGSTSMSLKQAMAVTEGEIGGRGTFVGSVALKEQEGVSDHDEQKMRLRSVEIVHLIIMPAQRALHHAVQFKMNLKGFDL